MQRIRITKEFDFEAAHALDNHNGKCKNIHGHSYKLTVTLIGSTITDKNSPQCGMVVDFADLKTYVVKNIISVFDHALVLRDDSRFKGLEKENERVLYVPYQPTCENVLYQMVAIFKKTYPKPDLLFSMSLRETSSSFAHWYASDNT